MQSAGREFLRLCGVAIIAAGLAAALALILIQLRLVPVSRTVIGYCGPGFTSASALQVKLDPGIVNTGGTGPPAPLAEQRRLEQLCTRQANGRVAGAGVLTGVALLLGLPLVALGSRQSTRPASPDSAEPSSLSSWGTSDSTVWK